MRTGIPLLMALLLTGCAEHWTRSGGPVPTNQDHDGEDIGSTWHASPARGRPCPPNEAAYRVRDLTKPWSQRRYLLPSGELCTPQRRI